MEDVDGSSLSKRVKLTEKEQPTLIHNKKEQEERDLFKETFKYYKAKNQLPNYDKVLDFDNNEFIKDFASSIHLDPFLENEFPPGIKSPHLWQCYELNNNPGLIFIKNPFTSRNQRYWITRCLQDYPKHPNVVNLNPISFKQNEINDWWSSLQKLEINSKYYHKLKTSMRWTTLGYHHDWDTKIYNEKMKNKFPDDLSNLCKFIAKILKFSNYSAEAAIVNYYPIGTTLAGHTDHSESDLEAPLFSMSFGQTAIFLIGGKTRDVIPTAIYLKSGDIVVMSRESRLCYHAVPRIMKADKEPWNEHNEKDKSNEIQKLTTNTEQDELLCEQFEMSKNVWKKCADENFWSPFNDYSKDSRININVRQVLKEGQISL